MSTRIMCDFTIDAEGNLCNTHVSPEGDTENWRMTEDYAAFGDYCPEHASQVTWIRIEREHSKNAFVGPYKDEAQAEHAMNNALLIDGICEEDALDAYIEIGQYSEEDDVFLIDLNNPHHTGVQA